MPTYGLPPGFDLERTWLPNASTTFAFLTKQLPWQQCAINVFGRSVKIPRLVHAMGDAPYSYSGYTHNPAPWHPWIEQIRASLAARTGVHFNTCLANLYRDGSDSISWHADDEPELGPHPTIASVSLGAPRTFAIKRRDGMGKLDFELGPGDLLVMSGDSQRDYLHSVPKRARAGARINLTFRHVLPV